MKPSAVVVLSTRGFGAFRHDLLVEPDQVRFLGIFTEQDAPNLTAEQREYFDDVRVVACAVADPSPMLKSLVDQDEAADALAGYLRRFGAGRVRLVCYDEQNMLAAAGLRSAFGLAGTGRDEILPFRDKVIMKSRLVGSGIRVPRFGVFDQVRCVDDPAGYFDEIAVQAGLPFILKPVDSAGGDGVCAIADPTRFAELGAGLRRAYEWEEFIDGTIFSVNIVAQRQQILFAGVTEYLVNSLQVQQGRVNADINLLDDDERVPPMIEFAQHALRCLGWPDGASHLELFRTNSGELIFLEVAARFKGMAGLAAMQRHYGVALVNLALAAETGIASRPYDREAIYCFDGVVPREAGVIAELVEPELESMVEMNWSVLPGQAIEQSDSLLANGGTFLVSNRDFAALYRDFRRLADYHPIVYAEAATTIRSASRREPAPLGPPPSRTLSAPVIPKARSAP